MEWHGLFQVLQLIECVCRQAVACGTELLAGPCAEHALYPGAEVQTPPLWFVRARQASLVSQQDGTRLVG